MSGIVSFLFLFIQAPAPDVLDKYLSCLPSKCKWQMLPEISKPHRQREWWWRRCREVGVGVGGEV